ncbi:MAG: LptF/LptG family permease [Nitrospirae bacterium]|nr:LptF/LptG family permease [Nitrospirota bacterium]
MVKIIDRYILRELSLSFILSIAILLSAFLMQQVIKFSKISSETGISFLLLVKFSFFIIPLFLVLAIPLSVLISSILTFSRLSTDNEVTAMRSGGLSVYRMLFPVLIFSITAFLLALVSSSVLQPMGHKYIRVQAYETLNEQKNLGLHEGVFNNLFNLLVYVKKITSGNTLNSILISDRSAKDSKIITARQGNILNDPSTSNLFLKLQDGHIYFETGDKTKYQMVTFSTYLLRLESVQSIESVRLVKETWGLSLSELKKKINDKKEQGQTREYRRLLMEYYKKFSLPAAALVLGLLGSPIGIVTRFSSRFAGFILSIVIVFSYYILDTGFEILAVEGYIHPVFAAWATVFISLMLAIITIVLVSAEKGIHLLNIFSRGK